MHLKIALNRNRSNMTEDTYQKLFSKLEFPELPDGLLEKTMARVQKIQRRSAIRQLVIFSLTAIASMAAFIPGLQLLKADLFESGFLSFLSLLWSDYSIIMTQWQNLGLALLESLPVTSLAIIMISIFVFLQSLKYMARDIKKISPLSMRF